MNRERISPMGAFRLWRSYARQTAANDEFASLERSLEDLRMTVAALADEEGRRARATHERGVTLDNNIRDIQTVLARLDAEMKTPPAYPRDAALIPADAQPDNGSDDEPPPNDEATPSQTPHDPDPLGERAPSCQDEVDLGHFKRQPKGWVNGIPVFAEPDRYIENYQKIATDHLRALKPGAANPWIADTLWEEIESSTADLIRRFSREGQSILDVGVGLGRLLRPFESLDRHGVDISLDYLRRVKENNIKVAFARAEDLPYKDGLFDVLVCTDVLEHVFDLNRCCLEMLRVLRPGGTLIVRTPLEEPLDPYLAEALPYDFVHIRSFSLAGLTLLFTKALGCEFLASSTAGIHLQSAMGMRVRGLPRKRLEHLREVLSSDQIDQHGEILRTVVSKSDEEIFKWVCDLIAHEPSLYALLKEDLVAPLELNAVFRKPHDWAHRIAVDVR